MTKKHRKVWGLTAMRALENSSHMKCSFLSLWRCSALLEARARTFPSPDLSNLSPLYMGYQHWAAAPSFGWISRFPSIFFFYCCCSFVLAYLVLVLELSYPTLSILVCSLVLWHFSLKPFLMQGVSNYAALKNKIK